MPESRTRLPLLPILLVLLLLLAPAALAGPDEEAPAADGAEPIPAAEGEERPLAPKSEEPAGATGRLPGDRKIYVPFEKLEEVFAKEGQGVFVPYEEFMKLWRANLDRRPVPSKPPVPYLVTRASYEGRVEGGLAAVDARIEFETFTEGWSAVPLPFGNVAMGEATIDGAPATLTAGADGFRVLVPEKGSYALSLSFVAPVAEREDFRNVSFRVPPTPVSRLVFDVPEEDARVTVEPNLATTRTEPGSGTTRVMAYVGAADSISLGWRPKPVEVRTGPPLVFADVVLAATVAEAALRTRADVTWRIHRAPVESLRLAIPEGNRVLFVEGEEIRTWEVTDGVLAVRLHSALEGTYRLAVTLERDRPETGDVPVPAVRALGVEREQGFVTVRLPETVNAVPRSSGLYRTDFAAVPDAHRLPDLSFAWRYAAHPWDLTLAVDRIRPRVEIDGRTRISFDERGATGRETFRVTVSRAPVFSLRFSVPAGVVVTDVDRAVVEDHRIEGEGDDRRLVLDLSGSRTGTFEVGVGWTRALELGGEPLPLSLPLLTPLDVDRMHGVVGIARDEALKIETKETAGLVPLGAGEFGEGVSLAWRYTRPERSAALVLSRREAEVTARVLTSLKAEENRIAVVSRVTFTVKHAGVEEFSFLLPASLRDEFRVDGPDIREKPVSDAGDDRIRQRIVLQGKVTGEYVATVEYDLSYEGLASGESRTIEVPVLAPENVKRDRGAYAVYRESMLEIHADSDRLEPIDPRELPEGAGGTDVFLAFQYLVRPHSLTLTVTKHDPLEVLTAVVHHMQLVTVLNEEGTSRTEVILAMTNNGNQFLSLGVGAEVDSLEVILRNAQGQLIRRTEEPLEGEDGAILVRMPPEAGPDQAFYVRLVYRRKGELPGLLFHDMTWRAPAVMGGAVPVLVTTWDVYPPVGGKITQAGGTLTWFDRPGSWLADVSAAVADILPRRAPRRDRPRPDGTVLPGEIADPAPRDQTPLRFGGRVQDATVEVTFASPGGFALLRILVFLLVLAGGVVGLRRAGGALRATYVFGGAALALLFAPVAAPGTAEILSALLIGALAAGACFLVAAVAVPLAAKLGSKTPPDDTGPEAPSAGAEEE